VLSLPFGSCTVWKLPGLLKFQRNMVSSTINQETHRLGRLCSHTMIAKVRGSCNNSLRGYCVSHPSCDAPFSTLLPSHFCSNIPLTKKDPSTTSYKWSKNSAVGRESPFREDLSPEPAIVRSHYQAATSDDTAGWKRCSVCCSDL
jgi:hypothetical protein